jgi:hypothetical protein
MKFVFIITAGLIFLAAPAAAGAAGNVSGWAWIGADCTDPAEAVCGTKTAPVGWVSFNSDNSEIVCTGADYGININYDTGEISGSAFVGVGENADNADCNTTENSLGWLYFDSTQTPGAGYPTDYNFPAKAVYNSSGGFWEIQGWAPIISKDQNGNQVIITWVKFKKDGLYSVKINSDGSVGTAGQSLPASQIIMPGLAGVQNQDQTKQLLVLAG